jgi:hypothetical protein
MSQRSQSDLAATAMTRSSGASHAVLSTTKERRPSKESIESNAIDDDDAYYDESYEEEIEEPKPTSSKRHSSSDHTNVYTECGRHGDDWLFGGISDAVKTILGKNGKK